MFQYIERLRIDMFQYIETLLIDIFQYIETYQYFESYLSLQWTLTIQYHLPEQTQLRDRYGNEFVNGDKKGDKKEGHTKHQSLVVGQKPKQSSDDAQLNIAAYGIYGGVAL